MKKEAIDFDIRLDQIKGRQFMQAFDTLRGGGQITEKEGEKATAAISRMNGESSEEEFISAAREFQSVIKKGIERARNKATGTKPNMSGPPSGAAFGGVNPETRQMEYFDSQGNKL